MISGSIDAIVAVDKKGQIVEFNPRAEKLLGYTREEALHLGKGGVIRFYADGITKARQIADRLQHEPITDMSLELVNRQKVNISVLFSGVQQGNGSVGFFRDIREIIQRKLLEGLLESLKAAITTPDRFDALQTLVEKVAHELGSKSVILYLYDREHNQFGVAHLRRR